MIATQKNILSYSELTCKDKKTFKASRIYTLATQALDRYHLNMSAFYQVAAPQSFTACAVVLGENAGAIGACRWCPSAATPAPTANAGAVDRLPDRPPAVRGRRTARTCYAVPPCEMA